MEQLTESLLTIGFEKFSLKTTNFHVDTDYESLRDKQGNYRRVFRGFVCHHQLKLSFDFEMERLSQTLSKIAGCLVHPELRVHFTVKDPTAVNEALLREATINASKKAKILCEASDAKMGQLLSIDYNWGELNIYSNIKYYMGEEIMATETNMTKSIDIEPAEINVTDTDTFVWEIH